MISDTAVDMIPPSLRLAPLAVPSPGLRLAGTPPKGEEMWVVTHQVTARPVSIFV